MLKDIRYHSEEESKLTPCNLELNQWATHIHTLHENEKSFGSFTVHDILKETSSKAGSEIDFGSGGGCHYLMTLSVIAGESPSVQKSKGGALERKRSVPAPFIWKLKQLR